jgi:hypothetical protein
MPRRTKTHFSNHVWLQPDLTQPNYVQLARSRGNKVRGPGWIATISLVPESGVSADLPTCSTCKKRLIRKNSADKYLRISSCFPYINVYSILHLIYYPTPKGSEDRAMSQRGLLHPDRVPQTPLILSDAFSIYSILFKFADEVSILPSSLH